MNTPFDLNRTGPKYPVGPYCPWPRRAAVGGLARTPVPNPGLRGR